MLCLTTMGEEEKKNVKTRVSLLMAAPVLAGNQKYHLKLTNQKLETLAYLIIHS